jgi:hypothetical protein
VANARVTRGRATERLAAGWYNDRGWPDAEAVAASTSGHDIKRMPGLAPEVKARTGFDPLAWTRQASRNAQGRMPFVVMRCNGQGEAQIAEWLVIRQLGHDTDLLIQAGYPGPFRGVDY